jgi:hypothetical protein
MSVLAAEMVIKKALVTLDGDSNGDITSATVVNSGVRHGIFPRVTRAERTAGVTRYRKVFLANINNTQETAYGALIYLTFPSPAGDRFLIGAGTEDDTQVEMLAAPPVFTGCGKLQAGLSPGATAVTLTMEANSVAFARHGWLHLSNLYLVSQTAAAGIVAGQSVAYSAGTWNAASHNGDIVYPNGIWLGDGTVQTDSGSGTEEWLRIADVATPYSYVGNVCTVQLADPVVGTYTTTNTWAGGCVGGADLVPSIDTFAKASANGLYGVSLAILPNNKGTVSDDFTVTFTGTGAYTVAGARVGTVGSGTVGSSFSPINPETGTPYFTIPGGYFTGTWVVTDTFTFSTHPAALPIWLKEIVPAGTAQYPNNLFCLGWYWE